MLHYIKNNYPSVKNIVFDLGNVILDVDYMATIRAFKDLGASDFDRIYTQHAQDAFLDEWDKGLISPSCFRDNIRMLAPALRQVSDVEIDHAWNTMLGQLPLVRLQILKSLGAVYRLFLLSNTNEIHVAQFSSIVRNTSGANSFSEYFEKVYYSNEIGMRKPDVEIYEWVLAQNSIRPDETLFVDDLLPNIEGAKKAGMLTLHLCKGEMSLETIR